MTRYYVNKDKFWSKEFSHIKSNPFVKKQSLGNTTFFVYTITLSKQNNTLIIDHPLKGNTSYNLSFGQYISPLRNLSLLRSFYFDYDLSINIKDAYESKNQTNVGTTQIYETNKTFDIQQFAQRIQLSSSSPLYSKPLPNFYKLYLGYSKIRNYNPKYDSIEDYKAISSNVVAEMNDTCFEWLDISNNKLPTLTKEQRESFSTVLDYRLTINFKTIEDWITNNFTSSFDELSTLLGSNSIDLNFIFYPPTSLGMQFKDTPRIVYPLEVIKVKVLDKVVFEVQQSLIDNAQKVFEVIFTDKSDDTLLFSDSSIYNPSSFTIKGNGSVQVLKAINLEPNIFEDTSVTQYPNSPFLVEYKLNKELSKYLANNMNYKITVRVSDLTSERNI